MPATHEEWLNQAEYDMDTARFMFEGGRGFYAVFMCHLSIEKALKGLYQSRRMEMPPRTHNLTRLLDEAQDEVLLHLAGRQHHVLCHGRVNVHAGRAGAHVAR